MSFKIGDVVKLNSSGPLMTVTGTSGGPDRPTLFTCNSFNKDSWGQDASYPADAFESAKPPKPARTSFPSSLSRKRR